MFNLSETPVNQYCNDIDGTQLFEGDLVIAIDVEDLENGPKRGQLLKVTSCSDPVSNFIEFEGYAFYGHRVLKVIQ